jgi:glucokinase
LAPHRILYNVKIRFPDRKVPKAAGWFLVFPEQSFKLFLQQDYMAGHSKVSLYFPDRNSLGEKKCTVLGGDAGGTKVNLAIFEATASQVRMITSSSYHSSNYPSINGILQQFLKENPDFHPEKICLGVAGPVFEGRVTVTNLPWHVDVNEIAAATGISQVVLLNDLEATAYGIAGLEENDCCVIHKGDPETGGNISILAPGTGLGEAGLFWDGQYQHPFATEGGHCDFSCRNAADLQLHDYMLKKYAVVSWESVVAGPGIYSIYQFLCETKKQAPNPELADKMNNGDPSAAISEAAIKGTDQLCTETMRIYVRHLARECCNLILKMKSTGGLFLAGGIPPKIISLLGDPWFYENLLDCDRMQELVKKVPVKVILNDKAPMIGAGWYAAYSSQTMVHP